MIPSIETIVEDLLAGTITKQQALAWLFEHAEDAAYDLRDHFAAEAMNAELASSSFGEAAERLAEAAIKADRSIEEQIAFNAYNLADAMLKRRSVDTTAKPVR